jgi:hypothetical protein
LTIDDLLAALIVALLPFAWLSTFVLVWAARTPPRIGALTERAIIAVVIAVFLTAIAVIVLNTETDEAYFPAEVARVAFRVCVLGLGFVPIAWCALWLSGRLGESGHG